jgi:hypothetical protein
MPFRYHVLVVANRTAASDDLLEALQVRAARADVVFTLLVPPTAAGPDARARATANMEAGLERLRAAGLAAEGLVGTADPIDAVGDMWDPRRYDEVIVSTLPGASSAWLRGDLPHRIAALTGVQVTHVISQERRQVEAEPVPERSDRPGVLAPLSVLAWGGGTQQREPLRGAARRD